MRARGFRTPRASAHIGTAFGVALAGVSIALATPAYAAPEGPDSVDETVVDQVSQGSVVDLGHLGGTTFGKGKMSGVQPGLGYQRLADGNIFLDVG
jgi:hypothetical protein